MILSLSTPRYSWPLILCLTQLCACTGKTPEYCDEQTTCQQGFWCDLPVHTCRPEGPDAGTPDATLKDGAHDAEGKDSTSPDGDNQPQWVEEHYTANGEVLRAIWGSSGTDVWAAGDAGKLLRYDGTWTPHGGSTTEGLAAIWGASASEVWIGGISGTLLHFDGTVISSASSGILASILSIYGLSASDVWAGADDKALHFDGTTWQTVSTASKPVRGIWGATTSQIWAGTISGSVLHYDGKAWTATTLPGGDPNEVVMSVWGSAATDVWAVSDFGHVYHHDGQTWKVVPTINDMPLEVVWGLSASEVWIGGSGGLYRFDGAQWTEVNTGILGAGTTPKTVLGIWGAAPDDLWVLGDKGLILHYR